jgi:nitroreductase
VGFYQRREVWKYGERGFRYCQLDVGHALGSLRFAAAMAGYRLQVIGNVDDRALCGLIGTAVPNLIENDAELPALLAVLYPQTEVDEGNTIQGFEFPVELIAELQTEAAWLGRPNSLRYVFDM